MDFDADGDSDVLSGSWPGELYLFRRDADGSFQPGEILKDNLGAKINAGKASTVFAADWDNDRDLDLVLGNIEGEVHLVVNEGHAKEAAFGAPRKLELSAELKGRSGDSGPILADWNGDGLQDLLVGTGEGSVVWFRNVGSAKAPEFAPGDVLVEKSPCGWKWDERKPGEWGVRVKLCVADFNGDGLVDLLLGDRSGSVVKNPILSPEGEKAAQEAAKKLPEIQRQRSKLAAEIRALQQSTAESENPQNKQRLESLQAEFDDISKQYTLANECIENARPTKSTRNGFVWLFVRQSQTK